MSHAAALEKEVLGQLILSPGLLESCEDLTADLFEPGDHRRAFSGICELWEELRPCSVDPGILAHKAGLEPSFVSGLINGNFRPDIESFTWRVRGLRKRRAVAEILRLNADECQRFAMTEEVDPERLARIRGLWDIVADTRNGNGTGIPAGCLKTGAELQAMNLRVEWAIDRLLPARSLTLLYGRSGIGKTWLSLMIAKAVSAGEPVLGLRTAKRPAVIIDYENPLPVIIDRARKLDVCDVRFWHLSAEMPPPKLDSDEWELFKRLPAGSLLIFDTSRASHNLDGNAGETAALIMGRLKTLRELDHEIILLHHTTKADDQNATGSQGWYDLADHTLSFCRVKRGSLEEVDDGGAYDPGALLSLGVGKKTRFEAPPRLYLTLDPDAGGLVLAESPDVAAIEALAEHIAGPGRGINQSLLFEWAKQADIGPKRKDSFKALLCRGESMGRWTSERGPHGSRLYYPAS